MSVRLVKSGRWNPPVGIHGQGACPLPDDAEEVEDPLTDMLSKSATDPGPDPGGGGGGNGSGGPPAAITGPLPEALDSLQEWVLVWWHQPHWPVPPGQQLESPGVLAPMGLGWVEEVRDMGEVGLPLG